MTALVLALASAVADVPVPVPASGPTAGAAAIATAQERLASNDVDGALSALADVRGPLTLDQMLARSETLGIARAISGDADGAEAAFKTLLALSPTYALPYTLSPKVTFPFERARKSLAGKPSLDLKLTVPAAPQFDEPVRIDVESTGDSEHLLASLQLCNHVKGADGPPVCATVAAPGTRIEIGPIARPSSLPAGEGVYVQLSLVGIDREGSEVWRGPPPEHPLEIGVGLPGAVPWYANPWVTGGVGAGAFVVAAVVVAGFYTLRATHSPVGYCVPCSPAGGGA